MVRMPRRTRWWTGAARPLAGWPVTRRGPGEVEGRYAHEGQDKGDRPVDEVGVGVDRADGAGRQGPAGLVVAAVAAHGDGGEGQRREHQQREPGRALVPADPPGQVAR